MAMKRWPIVIPVAVFLLGSVAWGSAIKDEAKMFSPKVVEEAQRRLDRLERATKVPVVIETIEHVQGLGNEAPNSERREAINKIAKRRDSQIHDEGIYILISKGDRVISQPLIRERLEGVLPMTKRDAIREAFIEGFGTKHPDEGLKRGVVAIEKALDGVRVENARGRARAGAPVAVGPGVPRAPARGGGGFLGTFLMIGLGILAVLIVLRILGGLFGRSAGAGYPRAMGGPRPGMGGPGYGPGYGGGGGGGFFSGLLGGLGGALAGNWLYDQMSGRHGGMTSAGPGYPTDETGGSYPDQGGDAIIGAEDHGGMGGSWDDGGGDTGGGDWGGGDAGGDWGGGGGDWGGGGGDWGGGDGGGGGGDW